MALHMRYLGQEEILAQTYVDPPQLTRLGKRLGLKETVRNQEEFLKHIKTNTYKKRRLQPSLFTFKHVLRTRGAG